MENKTIRVVVAENKIEGDRAVAQRVALANRINPILSKFKTDTGYAGTTLSDIRSMLFNPPEGLDRVNQALTKFSDGELDRVGITSQMMRASFTANITSHAKALVKEINLLQSLPGAAFLEDLTLEDGQLKLTAAAQESVRESLMDIITNPVAKELLDIQIEAAEALQKLWDFVRQNTIVDMYNLNLLYNWFGLNMQANKIEPEVMGYDRICNKPAHAKTKAYFQNLGDQKEKVTGPAAVSA